MPSPDERSVCDDDGDDFPLPEGSVPGRTALPSPRLVPPRFHLVAAEFHPRRWLDIFSHRKTSYSRRWPPEGHQGAHEVGAFPGGLGAPPTHVGRVWPPREVLALSIFYIFGKRLSWSFRTFGAVQNRFLIFAPFLARIPATGILPHHDKPCKIRENSHKYCDITCNNSP